MKNLKPDSVLEQKWSQKRVLYSDINPYKDPGIDFSDSPSLTDQSQAEECDVNNIVKKFHKTGVLPGINAEVLYADVSDAISYHEAVDIVLNAQNQFNSLDAHTRKRFDNDPAQFLNFVHDPKNSQELIDLGLATAVSQSDTDRLIDSIRASHAVSSPSPADSEPAAGSRSASKSQKSNA